MTALADLGLYPELQQYGATDMSACFSCGNCTAICPLSENDATFPRRMIRYAQVGMKDALLSSKELWSCYHCGECSDSCPTQADPGEFMAAARRYAIASYDVTGLARLMYLRPVVGTAFALALAAFFALFMYTAAGPDEHAVAGDLRVHPGPSHPRPGDRGHGPRLPRRARRRRPHGAPDRAPRGRRLGLGRREPGRRWPGRAGRCGARSAANPSARPATAPSARRTPSASPSIRRRWFVHAMVLWGFLGLLLATILDYGLDILGIKATGTPVPIWYPVRLLGTVAGIMLVYGTTVMIVDRLRATRSSVARSAAADWTLLALLWITGVTGFVLELALYLPEPPTWGYWFFLFHVAVAMELVLLAPFMKLAHAVYRPVALFFLALAREPRDAAAGVPR